MIEKYYNGFMDGKWKREINVRDFIHKNYTPYYGDESFLACITDKTQSLWNEVLDLMKLEHEKGILDADTKIISGINSHDCGYINKDLEEIVGLQTDKPLKRAFMPYGGIKVAEKAASAYGYEIDQNTHEIFSKRIRKTHNDGVFDVYTDDMRKARSTGIITGLPDAYGRGRIIGDYRRVALYGVDKLIEVKEQEKKHSMKFTMSEETIRLREELQEQIYALHELKEMALKYGFDISVPAVGFKQAVQWTYLAYLAAVKEQNGAAMSLGRVSTFLDIYAERDIKEGVLTEQQAQEIMDHFVMKLRMVRFARTPDYDALFSGDPTWVTESIGGVGIDGRPLVTKNSFRILHTLYTLGPAPEPNLTILWSTMLPEGFKKYAAKVSIDTSSIQYENDDMMKEKYGDDYGIACCVSPMRIGKQMQFFGARANMAKAMLYAINGGKDEITGEQIMPEFEPVRGEYLEYDELMRKFYQSLEWLANTYINSLNIIHYMHDKYAYEKIQLALHDRDVHRTQACGIAGLSVVADALSAVKHAKVKVVRNENGLAVDYIVEGEYPAFGNNDDRVDEIAVQLTKDFMDMIRENPTYRNAEHTMSILTITSNVVYGKKTGSTPDGRKKGEPFAPGANPMHGRDKNGALASMQSVAKLPFEDAADGISYTFSVIPNTLGNEENDRRENLSNLLDGFFESNGHHININVLNREMLMDAMENPDKYPQLTIRVSGYAVNFIKLTKEQQLDVINRTFHGRI